MSMAESIAYNMDCLEYMRTLPDNYFDLCVADPPYGDAMQTDSVIDHLHSSARQQERERERERERSRGTDSASGSTDTSISCKNRRNMGGALREKNYLVGRSAGEGSL